MICVAKLFSINKPVNSPSAKINVWLLWISRALAYSKDSVKGRTGKRNIVVNPEGYNRSYQENIGSVSWGHHNKLPQLSGLRKKKHFVPVWETRCSKSRYVDRTECYESSRAGSFLTSSRSQGPQAFLGCGGVTPASASIPPRPPLGLSPLLSLIRTLIIGFRAISPEDL